MGSEIPDLLAEVVAKYPAYLEELRFRPARCYAISRPTPSIRVLWLEDLIAAKGTPFDVPTLGTIDLAAGNVFLKDDEAVAVDWASLTVDPVGVDGGCLTGSALPGWAGATIAGVERELFEAYLAGLHEAGWTGNRDDVRRAFLCLYGIYQLYCGLMPVFCGKLHPFPREFLEARFKTSLDTIPEVVAGVIQRFPTTIAELRRLVA